MLQAVFAAHRTYPINIVLVTSLLLSHPSPYPPSLVVGWHATHLPILHLWLWLGSKCELPKLWDLHHSPTVFTFVRDVVFLSCVCVSFYKSRGWLPLDERIACS